MLQNTEMVSLNVGKKNEHTALGNILNKKLTIGKTVNGQRLIGKVIHVGKKDEDDETSVINMNSEINLDESYNELTTSYCKFVVTLMILNQSISFLIRNLSILANFMNQCCIYYLFYPLFLFLFFIYSFSLQAVSELN